MRLLAWILWGIILRRLTPLFFFIYFSIYFFISGRAITENEWIGTFFIGPYSNKQTIFIFRFFLSHAIPSHNLAWQIRKILLCSFTKLCQCFRFGAWFGMGLKNHTIVPRPPEGVWRMILWKKTSPWRFESPGNSQILPGFEDLGLEGDIRIAGSH